MTDVETLPTILYQNIWEGILSLLTLLFKSALVSTSLTGSSCLLAGGGIRLLQQLATKDEVADVVALLQKGECLTSKPGDLSQIACRKFLHAQHQLGGGFTPCNDA